MSAGPFYTKYTIYIYISFITFDACVDSNTNQYETNMNIHNGSGISCIMLLFAFYSANSAPLLQQVNVTGSQIRNTAIH